MQVLIIIIVLFIFMCTLIMYRFEQTNKINGGGSSMWDKDTMNNVYSFVFMNETEHYLSSYVKFGIFTRKRATRIAYDFGEFSRHMNDIDIALHPKSPFQLDMEHSKLIAMNVFSIPRIHVEKTIPLNFANPYEIFKFTEKWYAEQCFSISDLWPSKIPENNVNSRDMFGNFITALLEPFGHLASIEEVYRLIFNSDISMFKERDDEFKNNWLRNYENLFCSSDASESIRPNKIGYGRDEIGRRHWAFSNDNEFICCKIIDPSPQDVDYIISSMENTLTNITKKAVKYMNDEFNVLFKQVIIGPYCFHFGKYKEIDKYDPELLTKFCSEHAIKLLPKLGNMRSFSVGCFDIYIDKCYVNSNLKIIDGWLTDTDLKDFWLNDM